MRASQHAAGRGDGPLWQCLTGVLAIVACLLLATPAYAADCKSLKPADFAKVANKSKDAFGLQKAVNAAYADADLDERTRRLLNDGYVGRKTVGQFVQFCTDINLPEADNLADELIAALLAFATITDKQTDPDSGQQLWRDTLVSPAFVEWAGRQPARTYGGYFNYARGAMLIPGAAFMLAEYAARKEAAAGSRAPAAAELSGLFMLRDEDFETLKAESVALGSLDGLLDLSQASPSDLRTEILNNLGLDGQQLPALVDQLLNKAQYTTSYGIDAQSTEKLRVAGLPDELLTDIGALQELVFATQAELKEQIGEITANLQESYIARIGDAVADIAPEPEETDPPSKDDATSGGQAATASVTKGSTGLTDELRARLRDDLPTALVQKLTFSTEPSLNESKVKEVIKRYRNSITDNIKPVDAYTITETTLADPDVQALTMSIPDLLLERLEPLKNIAFPNGELFRTAVRLTVGVGQADSLALYSILNAARKPDPAPTQEKLALAPIQWRGGDCGCGVFEAESSAFNNLYGIYPYWQAPQDGNASSEHDPETIDFSMLNRVGYYGVTFDANGKITSPLHFKQGQQPENGWFWQRQDFAKFVKRAHQYKTKVDLIVYKSDWQAWLPPRDGEDSSTQKVDAKLAASQLMASIGYMLNERILGKVNAIKPLISFGQSPARTLGDGVTFDFDFNAFDGAQQQWLFDEALGVKFFETLRQQLPKSGANVIVPGECLTGDAKLATRCRYYALDNLQQIEPYVDLFLVDMTRRTPGSDVLGLMRSLREHVEVETERPILAQVTNGDERPTLPPQPTERQIALLTKLVPLVSPQADSAYHEQFLYSDWYFAGIGTWQLSYDPAVKDTLRTVFIGAPSGNIIKQAETAVCNFACPQRWWLRSLIFLIAVISAIYVAASYWLFSLRVVYGYRAFTLGVVVVGAILITTLWCDPFWNKFRSLIMFFTLVGSLLAWLVSKQQKDRRRYYP